MDLSPIDGRGSYELAMNQAFNSIRYLNKDAHPSRAAQLIRIRNSLSKNGRLIIEPIFIS